MKFLGFQIIFLALLWASNLEAYDMTFNTDKDITMWKFNGSYIYSKSVRNVGPLVPNSLLRASERPEDNRSGVWLVRYNGPDADNFLTLKYQLRHHLFTQGWVHFIASPTVPITITTNHNQPVGKFWSDGEKWCDAVFHINLMNSVYFDIMTKKEGEYALIDRVVMGVMANLTALNGRELNPCLTSPPENMSQNDEDESMLPDMIRKTPESGQHHHHHHEQSPPDMMVKPSQRTPTPAPNLDTRTVTKSDGSETSVDTNDAASDVKCGCSCSCARIKSKKNQTMSG